MKNKILPLLILIMCFSVSAFSQNYRKQQAAQERVIKGAYSRHKVTPNEYQKLMDEQDKIKYAIEKYEADGVWTAHERDVVAGKLERAEQRLKRYKHNGEVY
jgi:ATP-dependent protease HslVU (ClpYQ) ATPase subunit